MLMSLDPLKAFKRDLEIATSLLLNYKDRLQVERLRKTIVLDSIDEAILITDENDQIKFTNLKFKDIFRGIEWEDKHISKFKEFVETLNLQDPKQSLNQAYQAVAGKQNYICSTGEIEIDTSHQHYYFQMFVAPIVDKHLGYLGRIWKFEDITQEKRVDIMKTEFISIASHQLRTPITVLNGYLSMVEDGDFGEVPLKLLPAIQSLSQATDEMTQLVNDLLDISRIESGKTQYNLKELDLVNVLKLGITSLQEMINDKHLHLFFTPEHHQIPLKSDANLIREMFKNYLSNAIKYSRPWKKIWVFAEKNHDHTLKVSVKDEGIGIPEDQQDQLFKKFFRARNAVEADNKGTGLGLYYVKKCAELLGGTTGFNTKPNFGTEFWFTLPLEIT